jgi:hypothetical protein
MKLGVLTIRYEGTQTLGLSGSSPDVYSGLPGSGLVQLTSYPDRHFS